ncbi:hypothetical protein L3i23_20060 [Herbiconiux sp. L3-i23]|nr:hypothetical protein L3i23_20060 [Herbiconiux sp. L3-i23]
MVRRSGVFGRDTPCSGWVDPDPRTPLGAHRLGKISARFGVIWDGSEETMKVRNSISSLKKIPGSQVVRRRGRVFVINKRNPRITARQG